MLSSKLVNRTMTIKLHKKFLELFEPQFCLNKQNLIFVKINYLLVIKQKNTVFMKTSKINLKTNKKEHKMRYSILIINNVKNFRLI